MTEARIFTATIARAAKFGWNKTVGQQYVWGQYPVDHPKKLCHQSCLRQKNVNMTKRTAKFAVAVVATVCLVWR
jgi:hypothetical protein